MSSSDWKKDNDKYWNKINRARRDFQAFISYEWNYAVHLAYHRRYDANVENSKRLIKLYLNDLRRERQLLLSAFYIIPKSYIDPYNKPHHIHILLMVLNPHERMKMLLKDATLRYDAINTCEVHKLYGPEAGINYLTKFKNLNLTDLNSFYFDLHKEQLLKRYGNPAGYINAQLERLSHEIKS